MNTGNANLHHLAPLRDIAQRALLIKLPFLTAGACLQRTLSQKSLRISPYIIHCQKLDYLVYISVADSVGLSSTVFFYVICPHSCQIWLAKFGIITQITAITPVKITDFVTNRKRIYDFLWVINSNLHRSSHRFQFIADYWSNFAHSTGGTTL